ncbi:hypothetical protein GCM10022241_02860 [Micrococcus endophyticus]
MNYKHPLEAPADHGTERSLGGSDTKKPQLVDGKELSRVHLVIPGKADNFSILLLLLRKSRAHHPVGRAWTCADALQSRGGQRYLSDPSATSGGESVHSRTRR